MKRKRLLIIALGIGIATGLYFLIVFINNSRVESELTGVWETYCELTAVEDYNAQNDEKFDLFEIFPDHQFQLLNTKTTGIWKLEYNGWGFADRILFTITNKDPNPPSFPELPNCFKDFFGDSSTRKLTVSRSFIMADPENDWDAFFRRDFFDFR